jgi:hypothetical protein
MSDRESQCIRYLQLVCVKRSDLMQRAGSTSSGRQLQSDSTFGEEIKGCEIS